MVLHSTSSTISLGLFCAEKGPNCLDQVEGKSSVLSATLLLHLDALLKKHSLTLKDLAFIGAHLGPGPFTTVRVLLSYVNGLAFAHKTTLIGIDGFDAFLSERSCQTADYTLVLLNAFCNEAYYALRANLSKTVEKGCLPIDILCEKLAHYASYSVEIVGEGAKTFENQIKNLATSLPGLKVIDPLLEFPSLDAMGAIALKTWMYQNELDTVKLEGHKNLLPLYLKGAVSRMIVKVP